MTLIVIGLILSAFASLSVYVNDTYIEREGFIETFDSVVADEALVALVTDSFNNDFEELGASALRDGRFSLEDIDFEQLGISILDEDGVPLEDEELLEALQAEQATALRHSVDDAVNRPDFAESFRTALGGAHDDFIDALDSDVNNPTTEDGQIYISINDTYARIVENLEEEPAARQIVVGLDDNELGVLKVGDLTTTTDSVWSFFRIARDWSFVLIFFCVAAYIGAVLVAERRPQAIMAIGMSTAFLALIIILVAYGIWGVVPVMTKGGASGDLVSAVFGRAVEPLLRIEVAVIIGGVVVGIAGWLLRWVWPDDWVYSYYDDGSGTKAVARRATRAEIEAANQEAALAFGSGPGYGASGADHGARRWDSDDEWSNHPDAARVDAPIEFPSDNDSFELGTGGHEVASSSARSRAGSSAGSGQGDGGAWDYGDAEW